MSPSASQEKKKYQTQMAKSSRLAQTLFAYPDGSASIENANHESNHFVPRQKTPLKNQRSNAKFLSFQQKERQREIDYQNKVLLK